MRHGCGCLRRRTDAWITQADVEAALLTAGYRMRRSKVDRHVYVGCALQWPDAETPSLLQARWTLVTAPSRGLGPPGNPQRVRVPQSATFHLVPNNFRCLRRPVTVSTLLLHALSTNTERQTQ